MEDVDTTLLMVSSKHIYRKTRSLLQ